MNERKTNSKLVQQRTFIRGRIRRERISSARSGSPANPPTGPLAHLLADFRRKKRPGTATACRT
jgi:hypothetical protein